MLGAAASRFNIIIKYHKLFRKWFVNDNNPSWSRETVVSRVQVIAKADIQLKFPVMLSSA